MAIDALNLHPNRQVMIGVVAQPTPGTDPGAFVIADLNMHIFGEPKAKLISDLFEVEPLTSKFVRRPALTKKLSGTVEWQSWMQGAGVSATPQTSPSWEKGMLACGMQAGDYEEFVDDGAPSGTPITGEVFNNGAVDFTFIRYDASVDKVYCHTADTIVAATAYLGANSGAVITSHATPAQAVIGNVIWPDSTPSSYKVGILNTYATDLWTQRSFESCRGSWNASVNAVGEPMMLDFSVLGVAHGTSPITVKEEIGTALAPTYDSPTNYGWRGVTFEIAPGGTDTGFPIHFNNFSISSGLEQSLIESADATAAFWGTIGYAIHGSRKMSCTLNPMMDSFENRNWYNNVAQSTTGTIRAAWGTGGGNLMEIYIPEYSTEDVDEGTRDQMVTVPLTLGLNSPGVIGDNEIFIITM